MIKRLVPSTHPVLFKKAKKIIIFDENLKRLLLDIEDTLCSEEAPVLSAPRIGVSQRVAMIDMKTEGLLQLINPKIKTESNEKITDLEGSVSPPNVFGEIECGKMITVEANNLEDHEIELTTYDDIVKMILHITDQLDGIPFTEHAIKILTGKEVEAYSDNK